jgi:hypothetical protein
MPDPHSRRDAAAEQWRSHVREEAVVTRRQSSTVLAVILTMIFPLAASAQEKAQQQPAQPVPKAEARERNLRAYIELLRSDVRSQKIALITQIMQFTEDEDTAFWPVYREYEVELSRFNDDRMSLIETYAKTYDKLTNQTADDVVIKALDLETRRTALKQKYYTKLKSVVSPRTAARFMQVENQIQLLLDLQIAAALPVLQ